MPLFQEQLSANGDGGRQLLPALQAEELRKAVGMRRSVKAHGSRVDGTQLRKGMTENDIDAMRRKKLISAKHPVVRPVYGFPESHAASFALIAYASAYFKVKYLAAFTCAILNNQPMGFYTPAVLVKDAQRHGLRVKPVDVQALEYRRMYGRARTQWLTVAETRTRTTRAA